MLYLCFIEQTNQTNQTMKAKVISIERIEKTENNTAGTVIELSGQPSKNLIEKLNFLFSSDEEEVVFIF